MAVTTREKLVLAFERQNGRFLSGAALAKSLGVSRASIWKHIQALTKAGLPFEGTTRNGYRLNGAPDFSLVNARLSEPAAGWTTLHHEFSVPSTQSLAKAAALTGTSEGHLWIAEIQTAGRGRLDRAWESSFGGLWFSLLLRPALAPAQVPALTLVAAIALSEAVRDVAGLQPKLKWPNDLLVQADGRWKKLAGILTEMSGQMDRTDWVVIGVGMNVHNPLPKALTEQAASLGAVAQKPVRRADILDRFLTRFRTAYPRLAKEGFDAFRADYWRIYSRPDEPVRLKTAQGEIEGTARGVDGSGALIVESLSRRQTHHLFEGEIVT